MKRIYLDHNSTTPVRPEVLKIAEPFTKNLYGNPSSVHSFGREAREAIDIARVHIASSINASDSTEIFFTSGGTESDNLAIRGILNNEDIDAHIITTQIEHNAVLDTCDALTKEKSIRVTYVKPDKNGLISSKAIKDAIKDNTKLISVILGNNEIGTVQSISAISSFCKEIGILFHTDAVQALGKIKIDVQKDNIDLLSGSGHKINAPKGIGFLYARKNTPLNAILTGGGQEQNIRSGTENVPGIVALGEACRILNTEGKELWDNVLKLRNRLESEVCQKIPDVQIIGDKEHRLPGTSNIGFSNAEGETLLIRLDLEGIAVSTGSACSSGSTEPSHVLLSMDLPQNLVRGSLRFSLGWGSTDEDIDYLMNKLPDAVEKVRKISPNNGP
ncbi:MAG: cysteine desulfurase family protein [Nitrospinota bacterium]|nr:cysteine desulfurase family protein [Nitrospinota bacterium]